MRKLSVTAIIPVFNGEAWIAEALSSVLNQTYPVDQILVVDDGSTDRTAELASRPGVTVIRLETNSGEAHARNVGIKHAVSDFIAMLDADDYWGLRHIEVLVSLLEMYPEASIACAATQRVGLKTELVIGYVPPGEPRSVFWKAFDDWLHTTIGALFRREALLSIGGFAEDQRFSVDYDMWVRLSREHLFVSTHKVTSYWRWHANQQSQNYPDQLLSVYYFRHKYWKFCLDGQRHGEARQVASRAIELWIRDCSGCRHKLSQKMRLCIMKSILYLRPATLREFAAIFNAFFGLTLGYFAEAFRLALQYRLWVKND